MQKWKRIPVVLAVLLCVASPAQEANKRSPAAKSSNVLSISKLKIRKASFYRAYVSQMDTRISNIYFDRWRLHHQQEGYNFSNSRQEFLGFVPRGGIVQYEEQHRSAFATEVFRLRLDGFIKYYFTSRSSTASAKRVEKAYRTFTAGGMGVFSTNSTKVQMGYDMYNDLAHVQLTSGAISAGIYHEHMVSALTGGAYTTSHFGFRFGALLSSDKNLRAFLRYRLSEEVLESGLRRQISAPISTEIKFRSPIYPSSLQSVEAVLSIQF